MRGMIYMSGKHIDPADPTSTPYAREAIFGIGDAALAPGFTIVEGRKVKFAVDGSVVGHTFTDEEATHPHFPHLVRLARAQVFGTPVASGDDL